MINKEFFDVYRIAAGLETAYKLLEPVFHGVTTVVEANSKYEYGVRWSYGKWDRYMFDEIPTKVMEEIEFCMDNLFFSEYIILTTEKATAEIKDPLLIGKLEGNLFLMATWGQHIDITEEDLRGALRIVLNKAAIRSL
jgi:hypothetical protein